MKPMKGKGPKKAPTAPKAPGTAKKGKYQSKTGNMECSNAMSVWQKALHAGITPGKQVYEKLAQCRASVRTNKQNAGKVAAGSMKQSAASAVSNRSDRRIVTNTATAKARKERLKELVQARASRNISTADRQKAMDTAAKVTGNQTGPSAGLKRLQKVAKPRAAAAPKATTPTTTTTTTTSAPKAAPKPRSRSLTPKQPVVPLNPPGFNRFAQHRADAAALLRNMRATGRRDEAANLRGFSKASLMTRIGVKPADVRNYTGGTIMDIASKNKIGIQPVTPPLSKAAALVAKEQREAQALPKPAKAIPSTPKAAFTPLPKRERTYKPFGQSAMGKSSPEGQRRGSAMRKTQVPAIKERLETLRTNRAAAAGAIPISFKKQTPKGFTANLITGVSGSQFPIAVKPVRRDTGIQATSSRGDFRVVQPSSGMIALPNMLKRDQATRAARAMDYLAERASRGGGAQGLEALRSRPDYYKIVKRWADRQSYNPSAKKGR